MAWSDPQRAFSELRLAAYPAAVARDQDYISKNLFEDIYEQVDTTSRLISGLITYLRNNEGSTKQTNKPNNRY
jgi:hypothetical protein